MSVLQIPLPLLVPAEPSFNNFLRGANDELVATLEARTEPGPPLFLWGPAGVGKTHLLRAMAERLKARQTKVLMVSPHERKREVLSLRSDFTGSEPRGESDGAPWLLIDDCDRLSEADQAFVFAAFVETVACGGQVIGTARVPPVDLMLRDDLRTRLAWGLAFAMAPLDDEGRRAALKAEAHRRGLTLGSDLLSYLLTRFERDLKSLMALLERADQYALAAGRSLTVPLLKQMIEEERATGTPWAGGT